MNKSSTEFSIWKNVDDGWRIVEIVDFFAPFRWGGDSCRDLIDYAKVTLLKSTNKAPKSNVNNFKMPLQKRVI